MSSESYTATSFVGLLNLKKEAVVGLDGQTIFLKTDDFVGIGQVPSSGLHLVTVRSQATATVAVGFMVFPHQQYENDYEVFPSTNSSSLFVRQYDPQTEEMSAQPVNERTIQNLQSQVKNKQLAPGRVLDYTYMVSETQAQNWRDQTSFILQSNILSKRGIASGDKIVPGAYHDDDDELYNTKKAEESQMIITTTNPMIPDGKSLEYPCIPVVDTTLSLRTNKHGGTKRYLSKLSPSERTQLFCEPNIASRLLTDVMKNEFDNSWQKLLGDLQLAYVMFLYMQCLASLEHWKDLVAMISLVEPDGEGMKQHADFYRALLEVLPSQILTMEKSFLEDIDEAGNNFLLPSLQQLCHNLAKSQVVPDDNLQKFQRLLSSRFPNTFAVLQITNEVDSEEEEDDDDAPAVVEMEDVQASLARSANSNIRSNIPSVIQRAYPLLVAAIHPHEDILMTCARALDEKTDVSLVRQAGSYLTEVEQQR